MQNGHITRTATAGAGSVPIARRWVSERDLSMYSGIAVRTLQRWRLFDQGPPFRKLGGAVRYDLQAFDEWVENCPGGGAR